MYNGWTPCISDKEADANQLATLQAMVKEYPGNNYWKNMLEIHLLKVELEHDYAWLNEFVGTPEQIEADKVASRFDFDAIEPIEF